MSKRVAAVVLVLATMVVMVASEASEDRALRFPGRPGTTTPRPRNPIFPRPSPPTSRPPPAAPTPGDQSPCPTRATTLPGFPGLPGIVGSVPSSPADCVTPLAGLMTCGTFLTGSESETPTPQSECCAGLSAFLNSSSSSGDRGDRTLRCLCPVILGDVNRMLPKPMDPVRMMYLPIACGVVLPPQAIYICFTGQPSPPVVTRIPESWENTSSGK